RGVGWLPCKRRGFELGLWLEKFARENPEAKGCVLESHGLFTWADDGKACYDLTLDVINRAIAWFEAETAGKPAFGAEVLKARLAAERRVIASKMMPAIRALIGKDEPKVGHFDDSDAVLEFVGSKRVEERAALGTACPDHFLRTKIWPLVLRPDAKGAFDTAALQTPIDDYRTRYAGYYQRAKHPDSP